MSILVTNDDGVSSPGIHRLAEELRKVGEVWVVAPDRERTAVAHALTLHKPLRIHHLDRRIFTVSGTPADCVNLAIMKILPERPALVVSGINKGVNLGDDVMYSGTVSAALEGAILGIPAIAVSQEGIDRFRFEVGAEFGRRVAEVVVERGLPEETILNVNVPDRPLSRIRGVCVTSLSRRRFDNPVVEKVDPHGRKYYWIAGTRVSWSRKRGSDHEAVRAGKVSVTPLHLDATYYAKLADFQAWEPLLNHGGQVHRRRYHSRVKS
jgi:5'-nucleotidase